MQTERRGEEKRYSLKNRSSTWSCWAAPVPAALPQTAAASLTHFLLQAVFYLLEKRGVWHLRPASRSGRFRTSSLTVKPSAKLCLACHLLANGSHQGLTTRMPEDDLYEIADQHRSWRWYHLLKTILTNLISTGFIFKISSRQRCYYIKYF